MTSTTTTLDWRPYEGDDDATVVGDLRVSSPVSDPRLAADRELLVHLPPGYEDSEKHYPVVYMHDGQNLFDEVASYSGEWEVDETMHALADEGIEAIVVGIPNADDDRGQEYTPYAHEEYGGGDADDYLAVLVDRIKPAIDERFRTESDPEATGIAGSSLGGLVSLYGFFEYPETFGFAGVFSPAFWWTHGRIFDYMTDQTRDTGRIYMDVGTDESDDEELRESYVNDATRMRDVLREQGYDDSQLEFVLDEGAIHRESAWARRFPDAMRFLLG
ncbi:alpha/beta hydrolase [Haloarchaeobius amylolyticus]|uniref:alpha/beta hydrolase n=1 Tax=Haloarchaeobius amylolyticus TaxID=1198296 RepID=UPI002271F44B|nr:alpha/beta hydrolase-fold protein [Haloarchaeobius amylolyticus]